MKNKEIIREKLLNQLIDFCELLSRPNQQLVHNSSDDMRYIDKSVLILRVIEILNKRLIALDNE